MVKQASQQILADQSQHSKGKEVLYSQHVFIFQNIRRKKNTLAHIIIAI